MQIILKYKGDKMRIDQITDKLVRLQLYADSILGKSKVECFEMYNQMTKEYNLEIEDPKKYLSLDKGYKSNEYSRAMDLRDRYCLNKIGEYIQAKIDINRDKKKYD